MDGRNDVYPAAVWNDFWAIESGEMPIDGAVGKYGLNSSFVYSKFVGADPSNLANRLSADPGWRLVYFDDSYALFVRATDRTLKYLEGKEFRYVSPFRLDAFYAAMDAGKRGEVEQEVARALRISNGSAKAHLLAAGFARERRDEKGAGYHMKAARERDASVSVGRLIDK